MSYSVHQRLIRNAFSSLNLSVLNGKISPDHTRRLSTLETSSTTSGYTKKYDDPHSLMYRYTSGRWLWNEQKQLAMRYVKFDIEALCSIAAQSVGSVSCTDAIKLMEGNFNKVLLLTMDDGKEVIAKVPNPNAGHAGFISASEVATMDFVRNNL